MNKKRALGIVVAFVLAGGYWWISSRSQMPDGGGNGAINIADWKTYRNDEYGFEVKYPGSWEFQDHVSGFKFGTKLENYNYLQENDAFGFIDVRKDNLADYGHGAPGPLIEDEVVAIRDVQARKRTYEGAGSMIAEGDQQIDLTHPLTREAIYQFDREGDYYYIQFTSASKNTNLWDNFDLMIENFRFLK